MSSSEQLLYCINTACANPGNSIGGQVCASCSTPLVYRYLWAVGPEAAEIATGELINERYAVVARQIWLDTKPAEPPSAPEELPGAILPYLRLYPQRLHVPEVYGFAQVGEDAETEILLLENVPVDPVGNLHPSLAEVWPTAPAVRQVYWLWQMLQLWTPLLEQGVVASLLIPDNIRVEGWRVWLQELYVEDSGSGKSLTLSQTRLPDLAYCWLTWVSGAQPAVAKQLTAICQQMRRSEATEEGIAEQLNQLLLELAAKLPVRTRVAGGTDTGPMRERNEDSYYPAPADIKARSAPPHDQLIPYLAIVCDGVGGHEGGEVASMSAVSALKSLTQTLLLETAQSEEITPPEMVAKQIEESIRVINNAIAARNDAGGREDRQRMGTTLVMALQLQQTLRDSDGEELGKAHELYVAHVGDSRAYWITSDYCHRLTVDDDVASREVRLGRSLYRQALQRADAGALTQALGTRDAEFLRPNIQRFIVEEDGLLLLCSDGLSDNDWVELSWANYAPAVLKGEMQLDAAVEAFIKVANEKNGYDNVTVVLAQCRLSPEPVVLFKVKPAPKATNPPTPLPTPEVTLASGERVFQEASPKPAPTATAPPTPEFSQASGEPVFQEPEPKQAPIATTPPMSEFSEASKALLFEESAASRQAPAAKPRLQPSRDSAPVLALLAVLLISGAVALFTWSQLNPKGFEPVREKVFPGK
jgi:protein phosphatase